MKKILMLIAMVAMFSANAFADQFTATCSFDNNSSAYVTAEISGDDHSLSQRTVTVYSYGEKEGSVIVVVTARCGKKEIKQIEKLVQIKDGKGSVKIEQMIIPTKIEVYNAICKPVKY